MKDKTTFNRRDFLKRSMASSTALFLGIKSTVAHAIIPFGFIRKAKSTVFNYVDDVFATYLYSGNSSVQSISNGIDLSTKGGMIWIKSRTDGTAHHRITDTTRGVGRSVFTNLGYAESIGNTDVTGFTSSGFSLGNSAANSSGQIFSSWTFRKAANFFDIVTYTGNGSTQSVPHSLGAVPGMIMVKRLSASDSANGGWCVWHRERSGLKSVSPSEYGRLSQNSQFYGSSGSSHIVWGNNSVTVDPTNAQFTVGSWSEVNNLNDTYVSYLFAHDTSSTGIIQCGSFTTDVSGAATVNLGWEPQFLLVKNSQTSGYPWDIIDIMRGYGDGKEQAMRLQAQTANAEDNNAIYSLNSSGFSFGPGSTSNTYIYLAIRRSNKPPTSATQVYSGGLNRVGTGTTTSIQIGFSPDFMISKITNIASSGAVFDRTRGAKKTLYPGSTQAEYVSTQASFDAMTSFDQNGITFGADLYNYYTNGLYSPQYFYNYYFLKRAAGFFDVVTYKGDGTTTRPIIHNLQAVPAIILLKHRNGSGEHWYFATYGIENYSYQWWGVFNQNIGFINTNTILGDAPTSSVFYTGSDPNRINATGVNYVGYLFATLPGISKVGSYAGSSSQVTVNCGFSGSARFVLLKRTDIAGGDWILVDSTRGSGVYMKIATSSTESSGNLVSFVSGGFAALSGNLANASVGATYVYLAIS